MKWKTKRTDGHLIDRIVDRVAPEMPERELIDITMDLTACHLNGCPLDLKRMAEWPHMFDLLHDVYGIARHIDRKTGKIGGFFVPRFAAKEK